MCASLRFIHHKSDFVHVELILSAWFLMSDWSKIYSVNKFLMSSNESIRFLQDLHQLHNDPLFVEFLQQLFPWVSSLAADSGSSEQGFRHIRWETEEIGKVLFAVHDNSEGILRLMRGSSDRPRCSWSQLLHGQHTTITGNFILDVFSFARPKRVITRCALTASSHRNGVYEGLWFVQHRDSAGATDGNATGAAGVSTTTSSECPAILEETWVYLQVDSQDGQIFTVWSNQFY